MVCQLYTVKQRAGVNHLVMLFGLHDHLVIPKVKLRESNQQMPMHLQKEPRKAVPLHRPKQGAKGLRAMGRMSFPSLLHLLKPQLWTTDQMSIIVIPRLKQPICQILGKIW